MLSRSIELYTMYLTGRDVDVRLIVQDGLASRLCSCALGGVGTLPGLDFVGRW